LSRVVAASDQKVIEVCNGGDPSRHLIATHHTTRAMSEPQTGSLRVRRALVAGATCEAQGDTGTESAQYARVFVLPALAKVVAATAEGRDCPCRTKVRQGACPALELGEVPFDLLRAAVAIIQVVDDERVDAGHAEPLQTVLVLAEH
jgi:hypothetical protein